MVPSFQGFCKDQRRGCVKLTEPGGKLCKEVFPVMIWGLCFGSLHVVTETSATSVSWVYRAVEKRGKLSSTLVSKNSL